MHPDYWNDAKTHLRDVCPTMAGLIAQYQGEGLTARGDGFYTLVRSVVGQQISVKAADAVWGKLTRAVTPLTPENLLRKREATLRGCGLSASKVAYARNVARFYVEQGIAPELTHTHALPVKESDFWAAHSDAEVIALLTAIKGIGSWTAEMFLIFHLLRPDVFPVKDLGLLKAIDRHVRDGATERLSPAEYLALAERWRPYRTVATWYLWRALDPVPVAY